MLEETSACTRVAEERLGHLVQKIAAGESAGVSELAPVLAMIVKVMSSDRDAAMWSIERDNRPVEDSDLQLAKRSAKFSLLAFGTGKAHQLSTKKNANQLP